MSFDNPFAGIVPVSPEELGYTPLNGTFNVEIVESSFVDNSSNSAIKNQVKLKVRVISDYRHGAIAFHNIFVRHTESPEAERIGREQVGLLLYACGMSGMSSAEEFIGKQFTATFGPQGGTNEKYANNAVIKKMNRLNTVPLTQPKQEPQKFNPAMQQPPQPQQRQHPAQNQPQNQYQNPPPQYQWQPPQYQNQPPLQPQQPPAGYNPGYQNQQSNQQSTKPWHTVGGQQEINDEIPF